VIVRLSNGIRIGLASGRTVAADAPRPDADINVLSHAHGDHLYDTAPAELACSALTRDLAAHRRPDEPVPAADAPPELDLLPSGHVPGSRAVLLDDGERRVLYTGDVSTRDRLFLEGFDPVTADVLVLESTYGTPEYAFPPQADLEGRVVDWLEATADRPVVLFGYSLGRAQELQVLARRAGRARLFASEAIRGVNGVIERAPGVDVSFDAREYDASVDLRAGDALVLPSGLSNQGFVSALCDRTGAVTAGFSGWAVDESFRYRGGYDETFVLSDHCDFTELVALVRAVDPAEVYLQHGFADEFATHLVSEYGYDAQSLRRDQTTLGDF
jgi:putative mRNA 3-end processing factor